MGFIINMFTLFIFLSLFWIINSGIFHLSLLIIGLVGAIATIAIYQWIIRITIKNFLDIDLDIFAKKLKFIGSIKYIFFILVEITKASIAVAKNIIFNREPFSKITSLTLEKNNSDLLITTIAHSITVTPGSISIFQSDANHILVHCLTQENYEEIQSQEGPKKIIKLFT